MKIQRIDHMHFKPQNFEGFSNAFEQIMGNSFTMNMDMTEEYGSEVSFEPYPIGLELFKPTDPTKSISGAVADAAPYGVFVITFKVENLKEAQAEMEAMGYKMLEYYDNGPIQEALFDTKEALGIHLELIEYPGDSMLG